MACQDCIKAATAGRCPRKIPKSCGVVFNQGLEFLTTHRYEVVSRSTASYCVRTGAPKLPVRIRSCIVDKLNMACLCREKGFHTVSPSLSTFQTSRLPPPFTFYRNRTLHRTNIWILQIQPHTATALTRYRLTI